MILALYYQYGTLTLYKVPLKRFSDQFSEYSTVGIVSYLIVQIIPVIYVKKYENSEPKHTNTFSGRLMRKTSVSDPHWFHCGSGYGSSLLGQCGSRSGSGSRVLISKNFTKNYRWKNLFSSKIGIYLSLGLHKESPRYRRSRIPSTENIQHLKTWNFVTFFYLYGPYLPSMIQIWIQLTKINADSDPKLWEKLLYSWLESSLQIFYLEDSHPNCWQLRGVHSSCSAPAKVYLEICWSGYNSNKQLL